MILTVLISIHSHAILKLTALNKIMAFFTRAGKNEIILILFTIPNLVQ